MRLRPIILTGLLTLGAVISVALYLKGARPPLQRTLTPAFQAIGTPVKTLDRLVGKVLPVSSLDERELGEVIRLRYQTQADVEDIDYLYVNSLLAELSLTASKPFDFQAYILDNAVPNAMALPGGAILVTRGLLETLGSEAELVAVLAHELGHIEQGHCFDAVKFSLTARKIGAAPLGNLADMTVDLLIGHSFSKTQEAEADQYSFMALVNSDYDPNAVGNAFDSMLAYAKKREVTPATSGLNPIRDYFMSHPPLELRGAKYRGEARLWWDRHPNEVRYVGEANLRERRHIKSMTMPSEWMSGGDPGA